MLMATEDRKYFEDKLDDVKKEVKASIKESTDHIREIVKEAFAVTDRSGVKLPWKSADEYLAYLKDVQLPSTAAHHSSMYQDIKAGRKTGIDFLNGAVVSGAEKLGLQAPYNAFISEEIRFMEALNEKKA